MGTGPDREADLISNRRSNRALASPSPNRNLEAVMNLPIRGRDILRTSILVFAFLTISLLAWGQHKESGGQGEHAGNPGRSGGQEHGSAPSHASGPSHSSAPSHQNSRGQREATGTQPGRTAGAPGHSGNAGNRGGNTPNDRSGNASGNHGRNPSG